MKINTNQALIVLINLVISSKTENKKETPLTKTIPAAKSSPKDTRFKSQSKTSTSATAQFKAVNDLDSLSIDELSCRPRTVTNVGLDYIINTDFKKGRDSFYRQERFRPEALWGAKELDFYEEECPKCPPKEGEPEDHRTKCLIPEQFIVTKGLAKNMFTVLYPLVGKQFCEGIKTAADKLQPAGNTQEAVAAAFENCPFEKDQFKAQSRNEAGTLPKKVVLYLLIKNQWAGFQDLLLLNGKLYKALKCSGFRKQANAEDIQTTLLNNEIVELKPPPVWVDQMVINTANTSNRGYNQVKLFVALGLGYMEYCTTADTEMKPETELTEEWDEQCKMVREYMISLWAWARDIKCGDDGWTPPAAPADPNDPTNPAPAAT